VRVYSHLSDRLGVYGTRVISCAPREATYVHRPRVHDGYECLGWLYQAKGDHHQAAECYRKVIAFARNEPHFYDPHFIDHFQDLIDRLGPQATADADD